MNRNPLVLVTASILTLASTATLAAPNAGTSSPTAQGEGKAQHRETLERFKAALEQLDLSDQQKEKIKAIVTETRSKLEALKGEKDARAERREIVQAARKEIIAVLTEAQKKQLREILENDKSQSKA